MSTLFYFREDFLPLYIWGLGGIIICIVALLRIRRLEKKFKTTANSNNDLLQYKYKRTIAIVVFYLLAIIPILGFWTNSSPLYYIGGILFVGFGLMFYLPSKK